MMSDQEKFDQTMRKVLTVSKAEMQRRIAEDNARTKIGLKRGPKPKPASPAFVAVVQN